MSVNTIRIETGINLNRNTQRYQVRVQDRSGASKVVSRTVDDLEHARDLVKEARAIRAQGGSVKAHWDAAQTKAAKTRVQTVNEVVHDWIEMRAHIVANSDHTRAGNHRNVRSIRPGTHEVDTVKLKLHVLPRLGNLLTTDLEATDVEGVARNMAEQGLGEDYQNAVLDKLRQVIGALGSAQRPDAFPWPRVHGYAPANPRTPPNVPSKWGGKPGDDEPVTSYERCRLIAHEIRAAQRIIAWLQAVMGLRRGEVMGLHNHHFLIRDGRLWVRIVQQMNLKTGRSFVNWVKADASNRELPVPHVMAEYLEMYWDRYHHGFRPDAGPGHPRVATQLVVTSTGRDTDGSFMGSPPTVYPYELTKALDRLDLAHGDLGYLIRPHSLRKTCSTYLLHAKPILRVTLEAEEAVDSTRADSDAERADRAEANLERRKLLDRLQFTPADVSRWMGHEVKQDRRSANDGTSASPVTLRHYGLAIDDGRATFLAIADFLDRVIRYEIGSLLDQADEDDLRAVVAPGDPDWVLIREAAAVTGKAEATLAAGVRNGAYVGQLAWFADGDRNPPGPRYVIARDDVERIKRRMSSISRSEAARRLGMSNNYVDGAIARGDLVVVEHHQTCVYIDPASVDRLRRRVAEAVSLLFPSVPISMGDAHRRFGRAGDESPLAEALDAMAHGASSAEAAARFEVNANTLRSVIRRRRSEADRAEHPSARRIIRDLFARPKRIGIRNFAGWVDHAVELGLLERVNHTHLRRAESSKEQAA